MKTVFYDYLKSIGITSPKLLDRIKSIYGIYRKLYPQQMKNCDIFVCDYFTEEGIREYESLWFFSREYCMEAKQFVTKLDLDILTMEVSIKYLNFNLQEYDFKKTTDSSRLNVVFENLTGNAGTLKASRENCQYLFNIMKKYLKFTE